MKNCKKHNKNINFAHGCSLVKSNKNDSLTVAYSKEQQQFAHGRSFLKSQVKSESITVDFEQKSEERNSEFPTLVELTYSKKSLYKMMSTICSLLNVQLVLVPGHLPSFSVLNSGTLPGFLVQ